MAIANYAELLSEAHRQPEPQRLLFVFARAELPDNPDTQQQERFEQGEGGVLTPALCVDKTLDELSDMESLVVESQRTGVTWDIVFVAALAGDGTNPPTSEEAERPLQRMVEALQMGSIDNFLAFDRQGDSVDIQ
ncbi:ribonucleotide reductase subunit alpha [Chromohalobacter canadensis]|uniref:Ribonucleotide reductase subunit alpha n=1 Tax=Chromohalobacter canadensis TaxID=141389 RepID=A0ABZ0YF82_9GAMM|nr:ribonucleotide reductase subunit alpha [Chromohalobacter canadensis]MCK0767477.1 ribonucleotide reductase subunit alpha [Chromohalobacter canadensis]WQH09920.1 ribonucleotide reductase subunit alpha [Chromohalobacter canadensis]